MKLIQLNLIQSGSEIHSGRMVGKLQKIQWLVLEGAHTLVGYALLWTLPKNSAVTNTIKYQLS